MLLNLNVALKSICIRELKYEKELIPRITEYNVQRVRFMAVAQNKGAA